MISDNNDDNGLELEDEGQPSGMGHDDSVPPIKRDIEEQVEPSMSGADLPDEFPEPEIGGDKSPVESLVAGESEQPFDDDFDVDITGDPDVDFGEDIDDGDGGFDMEEKRSGGLKKMAAPAIVLIAAAGIGGYIVMNPQILGQGNGMVPQPENAYVAQQNAFTPPPAQPPLDITQTARSAPVQEQPANDPFSDSPPQPTTAQNMVPTEPPEEAMEESDPFGEFDITEPAQPVEPDGFGDQDNDPIAAFAEEADDLAGDLFDLKEVSAPEPPADDLAAAGADEADDAAVMQEFESGPEFPVSEVAGEEVAQADVTEEPAPIEDITEAPEEVAAIEPPDLPEPEPEIAPEPEMEVEPEPAAGTETQVATQKPAPLPAAPSTHIAQASDVYYDGKIPTGPLATQIGPRKVDPTLEPASQFVVVKKTHEEQDTESLLVSANRALKLKRYDAALDMFDQLYDANPRDPRILMGRAVAQQNAGRTQSAIQSYEELLDIRPDDADAMLNMLGLIRSQYPSVALRRLMDLNARYPNNAGIAAQIGVTQADMGHYDDAMRYLGIAMSLEPQNAQHAYNRAIIADRNGDTKNAVSHYEQALQLDAVYSSGRSIPRDTVYDRLAVLRRR